MAFKFLSRPDAKQRVLRIDLARCPRDKEAKTKHADRAIVVTAERDRLTYFWNDIHGDWQPLERGHVPLPELATGPAQTLAFPWSRRNGVAATTTTAVVAYKRQLEKDHAARLYLDLLAWSEADLSWSMVTADAPVEVDLGFLRAGIGIDLWAWFLGDQLQIVTQVWVNVPTLPTQPPRQPRPVLALLQATVDAAAPSSLSNADAWTMTELDDGGFDFDARFDGDRIWVVHRREAAAMARDFKPTPQNAVVIMLDEAGSNSFGIDETPLVADMPRTVLLSCDPVSLDVKIDADDLPPLEHPQIQRISPLILTGDRLRMVSVEVQEQDEGIRYETRVDRADKRLVWRGVDAWKERAIGPIEHRQWPRALREICSSSAQVVATASRLEFATTVALKPTWLWRYEVSSKGTALTFAREDRAIGGIACDEYLATPDLRLGEPRWVGRSVLDIGHEEIARNWQGESPFPAENPQFHGLAEATGVHVAGGRVEHRMPTAVTLGALLVSHQDDGLAFCAYGGMGDGGGRVIFASKAEPPQPTITEPVKHLPASIVSGPITSGRAWVTLAAADFVDGGLPSYPVPYADFVRRMAPPATGIEFAFLHVPIELLLRPNTPRSISGGLQPLLDVIPVADLFFNPVSDVSLDDIAMAPVTITATAADDIQAGLADTIPEASLFDSDGQPFRVDVRVRPGVVQAAQPVRFEARVTTPGVTATAFRWTFTPPQGTPAGVPPITDTTATPSPTFTIAGRWRLRVEVDDATGRTSVVDRRLDVAPSLWNSLWAAHRQLNRDPRFVLGDTSLALLRHRLTYRMTATGARQDVRVEYLEGVSSAYRFEQGPASQQGRTRLRLPVTLSSMDASLTGVLGTVVAVRRVELRLRLDGVFSLGVVTSDRRSMDIMQRETFADLDSTDDTEVSAEDADVETVRQFGFAPGRAFAMTPSALAAKPVAPSELSVRPEDVDVALDLTPAAATVTFWLGVILALGLAAVILGPLAAAVAIALGPLAPGALAIGALVAVAVAAGLGSLVVSLSRQAVRALGRDVVRGAMTDPATLARIHEGLDDAGLMTYAGEGLAEAIAIRAIARAIADGHAVQPPRHLQDDPERPGERLAASGRERFRHQFFETVVVGAGEARVLLRVP